MRKGFTLIELMIVIAIIAIIAAIAIPNLLESRVTANESAASASLKSGVFPGQVQFQGGGYQDSDGDNVGEYGTLQALGGVIATNKIGASSIKLLQGPLASQQSWSGTPTDTSPSGGLATGFRYFAIAASTTDSNDTTTEFWVDGEAAIATLTDTDVSANNGERYWVAACAPEKFGDTGRRVFMITNDGQVRSPSSATALGAWYGGTTTPTNGTPSTTGNMVAGIVNSYAVPTTGTFIEQNIIATIAPVYAR